MNNQEKKISYLSGYFNAQIEVRTLQDDVTALRSRAEKVTPVLSDMPSGGQSVGFVSTVESLEEAERKLNHAIANEKTTYKLINASIENLHNPLQIRIMKKRYMTAIKDNRNRLPNWGEIAEGEGYSESRARHIHSEALKKIVFSES